MSNPIEQLAELISAESGVQVKPSQHGALRATVDRLVPEGGVEAFLRLAREPAQGSEMVRRLIDEITVKETSFLRDRRQLEALNWERMWEAARSNGTPFIRAWSAGCATGEEAYTLALLASEAFAPAPPPLRILATDISRSALGLAQEGRYGQRSVRELDPELRDLYFETSGDTHTVREQLRRLVRFARHNIVRDPIPPLGEERFHLILCRNVLIYQQNSTAERIVGQLEGALERSGTLMLGAADALCVTTFSRGLGDQEAERPGKVGSSVRKRLRRPLGLPSTEGGPASDDPSEQAARLLAADPLDAHGHFLRGLVELESGDAAAAVGSLRRALYVFPDFALAAFELGRAFDVLGERAPARRAYEQALRTIGPADREMEDPFLEQLELGDIAQACRARITSLR